MKKIVFSLLLVIVIATPSVNKVFADGMIIPPGPTHQIYETGQKAVIWYENGKETLILSITFKGNARDFVWVIPTPSRPEVEKSKDELFTALNDYTRPPTPTYDASPLLGNVGLQERTYYTPTVTVHETKKVDIYDIAVLESNDTDALRNWLIENGYEYPENKKHLLDHYIQKKWFFVAAKINTQALGYAGATLEEGHATPLSITFDSPTIIYPLKISGKGAVNIQGKKVAAYSFETGTQEWVTRTTSTRSNQSPATTFTYPDTTQIEAYDGKNSLRLADNELTGSFISSPISLTNQLETGRAYVLSGYLKVNNHTTATMTVSASNISNIIPINNLEDYSDWKRFEFPFTYRSGSNLIIQVRGATGESIFLDALQVDIGSQPSDFDGEHLPQYTSYLTKPEPDTPVGIVLYVFTDKKQSVPGFTTEFADHIYAKTLEKFSINDNGEPWINAKGRKYLTKLTRSMKPSEMVDDLVLREAEDQKDVNAKLSGLTWWSSLFLFILVAGEIVVAGYFLWRYSKRKE